MKTLDWRVRPQLFGVRNVLVNLGVIPDNLSSSLRYFPLALWCNG
jgi:hypothetical protein